MSRSAVCPYFRSMARSLVTSEGGFMKILLGLVLVLSAGWTTMTVVPVTNEPLSLVCIEHNTDVNVDDFVAVVQQRFAYHGIKTKLIDGQTPPTCPYTLSYTADRWWDFAPYMVD